jgi:ferredoxin
MPKKYHIPIKATSPRFNPVGKYATIEFRENCAGSCKECVKKKCVYEVFKDNYSYVSSMEEPEYVYTCQSCFRCVQECTKGIFSRVINPEYRTLGDDYFKPDIIHRTWYQAHTGKIPVSGAGYRGPFVGKGFDSMWTDMSEIVRPTRDGIHGREYINTCIELSRRVSRLRFKDDMSLAMELPPILEIPLPLMFQQPRFGVLGDSVLVAAAMAAHRLETMMFIKPEDYTRVPMSYAENLVPCITGGTVNEHTELIKKSRMVELAYEPGIENEFDRVRGMKRDVIIAVGMPLNAQAADRAVTLTRADVDTLHFYADDHGNEVDSENPRFLKEMIREIHLKLVEKLIRQKVKLVFTGGIAMAEHMAKAIICGADGGSVGIPLLIALECRVCYQCVKGLPCPVRLEDFDPGWGCQRIANLIAAWRNQLIEVMGAMGIREVRRLTGEVGRSMWFEDLERESFAPLFGERKVKGIE